MKLPTRWLVLFTLAVMLPANGAKAEEAAATGEPSAADESPEQAISDAIAIFARSMGAAIAGGEPDLSDLLDDGEELSPLIGQAAPEFEIASLNGDPLQIKSLHGQIVVLDFWATWCAPCVAAMPQLESVHADLADAGVVVVGVNQGDEPALVREFVESRGLTFRQALDPSGLIGNRYGANSIPQTVVIDANGVVQAVHSGFSPSLGETLRQQIKQLQDGETLYDPAVVAEQQQLREQRRHEVEKSLGPFKPERLQEEAFLALGEGAYFDGSWNPWITLPGTGERVLALNVGQGRIALVRPHGKEPQLIRPNLGGIADAELSDFTPLVEGGVLHWVAASLQEEGDKAEILLGLFGQGGERMWTRRIPVHGEYSDVNVAAGDLDGDGVPEIATLAEHYNLTDDETYTHIVTVFSRHGEMLSRVWIDGWQGTGIYLLPQDKGAWLIVNVPNGARCYRLNLAEE